MPAPGRWQTELSNLDKMLSWIVEQQNASRTNGNPRQLAEQGMQSFEQAIEIAIDPAKTGEFEGQTTDGQDFLLFFHH